ncbi:MAG: hypothetical protein ABR587_15145, partial [Candidatus Binatia bacterium]
MTNVLHNALAIPAFLLLVSSLPASAGPTPAQKCESAKLREAGKYGTCRLTVMSKSVSSGNPADFSKCDMKFGEKWQKAEDKGQGACPTEGDSASLGGTIGDHTTLVASLLGGGTTEDPDGVYVDAASGTDDSSCGSQASPCASITFGLSRAVTLGSLRAYVSDAAYFEDVALVSGIDVLGGYDVSSWEPGSSLSVLYGTSGAGHRAAVSAIGVTSATTITGFVIHGATASSAASNSYAVLVRNSPGVVTISGNVIYAGEGALGAAASPASSGLAGVAGGDRSTNPSAYDAFVATGVGACNVANNRQLTNGGARTCGVTSVNGGRGGGNACPASNAFGEASGVDGLTAASGGAGGDAGNDSRIESSSTVCASPSVDSALGANGADAADAAAGVAGSGCSSAAGSVLAGNWIGSPGGTGGAGGHGFGGGGG